MQVFANALPLGGLDDMMMLNENGDLGHMLAPFGALSSPSHCFLLSVTKGDRAHSLTEKSYCHIKIAQLTSSPSQKT